MLCKFNFKLNSCTVELLLSRETDRAMQLHTCLLLLGENATAVFFRIIVIWPDCLGPIYETSKVQSSLPFPVFSFSLCQLQCVLERSAWESALTPLLQYHILTFITWRRDTGSRLSNFWSAKNSFLSEKVVFKNTTFAAKNRPIWANLKAKIKPLSTQNLFCWKFAALSQKIWNFWTWIIKSNTLSITVQNFAAIG